MHHAIPRRYNQRIGHSMSHQDTYRDRTSLNQIGYDHSILLGWNDYWFDVTSQDVTTDQNRCVNVKRKFCNLRGLSEKYPTGSKTFWPVYLQVVWSNYQLNVKIAPLSCIVKNVFIKKSKNNIFNFILIFNKKCWYKLMVWKFNFY